MLENSSRSKLLASAPVLVIFVTATIVGLGVRPSFGATEYHAGVSIPLYNYPDSTWTTIIQTHDAYPNVPIAVVVNPNNGPGSSEDPTYLQGIQKFQADGIRVLGYVDMLTGGGTLPAKTVAQAETQVSEYHSWYAVDGIFFDDMNNGFTYSPSTYATLNSYAKSLGMTYTMGNPGTSVSGSYIGTFDNLVIYESSGYPPLSALSYPGYPSSDFTFVAYGVPFNAALVTSAAPYVGYMYIDNFGGSNPYYTLSSLFAQTVATLSAVDSSTTTTSSAVTTSSATSSTTSATSSSSSTAPATGAIAMTGAQSVYGTVSTSPYQVKLPSFNAGAGSARLLLVGVSSNDYSVGSITFGGVPLTRAVYSFYNNDAELWYLLNPSGTASIVVTMTGPTAAVVGAYALSGVDQSNPVPTTVSKNSGSSSSSPSTTLTTKYPNSWVVDLPSIYGGVTLGSPTCQPRWDANLPSAITGASSSKATSSPGQASCGWTASGGGEQWDDVAVELRAATGTTSTTTTTTTTATSTVGTGGPFQLTVTSRNLAGTAIVGFWTTLYSQSGSVLATGYTPASYTLNGGQYYYIEADGYGACAFDHWADTGGTSNVRVVEIGVNTILVAVYRCI